MTTLPANHKKKTDKALDENKKFINVIRRIALIMALHKRFNQGIYKIWCLILHNPKKKRSDVTNKLRIDVF